MMAMTIEDDSDVDDERGSKRRKQHVFHLH